jgi:hypothetical protein
MTRRFARSLTFSLAALAAGPALASTPVHPVQALRTEQPFLLALYVDPGEVRELQISRRVFRNGTLVRSTQLPPIAINGEPGQQVPISLNLETASLTNLASGYYALVVTATGVPRGEGAGLVRRVPVFFRVANRRVTGLTREAYSAAVEPERLEGGRLVQLGAVHPGIPPLMEASSNDLLMEVATFQAPNDDRSETGKN